VKYEALYKYTIENGGATVELAQYPEKLVMPTKGYAVSLAKGTWGKVLGKDAELFDVMVERALVQFPRDYPMATHLGTWLNDDIIHIDPIFVSRATRVVNCLHSQPEDIVVEVGRDVAIGIALATNQESIFDLRNQKVIYVRRK
jgi:hypothetical protein